MKLLLIGSGGREHALAWKLSESALCTQLFIAPGNAGTSKCGKNINIQPTDFEALFTVCIKEKIEMVVVGPEEALVKGIADFFHARKGPHNIRIIGPSREGAQLEGSKAFAKAFMQRHHIPTAAYREFNAANYSEGIQYIREHALPIVLKADGLAAGKGVLICNSHAEAIAEFELMIHADKFGEAGKKAVVEEFLSGIELSVFALTDGRNYVLLPEAKDYKRVGERDTGLNTGGMGAISPVRFANDEFMKKVNDRIVRPTIEGLNKEKILYKGFIFFGLIKVGEDPFVIEYNCRLGDPETEVVIPRLKNDLVELLTAADEQKLDRVKIDTDPRTVCTVVAVSGGYPGEFKKGFEITGLDNPRDENTLVFHAATHDTNNVIATSGGRVLCVSAYGNSVSEAVNRSKEVLKGISFTGMYYRRDIGFEFEG